MLRASVVPSMGSNGRYLIFDPHAGICIDKIGLHRVHSHTLVVLLLFCYVFVNFLEHRTRSFRFFSSCKNRAPVTRFPRAVREAVASRSAAPAGAAGVAA